MRNSSSGGVIPTFLIFIQPALLNNLAEESVRVLYEEWGAGFPAGFAADTGLPIHHGYHVYLGLLVFGYIFRSLIDSVSFAAATFPSHVFIKILVFQFTDKRIYLSHV
jgi:hypothetical protein